MNILKPVTCKSAQAAILSGAELAGREKYFMDESRRSGRADFLVFPRTTEEVSGAVQFAIAQQQSITVSGARTGLSAGAVPADGMLLSLERMNRICGLRTLAGDELLLHCQAGVTLAEIQQSLRTAEFPDINTWDAESLRLAERLHTGRYFYPPDPTETSAALGGTIACNASGAHTFRYGPTRPYVHWLRVVLADGRVLEIQRGQHQADRDGVFYLEKTDGSLTRGRIPSYKWPDCKNAAGYYAAAEMDLIDFFIGSEGTLGIITEAKIRLIPAAEVTCAVMNFWPHEAAAMAFTAKLRERKAELDLDAIEYFGPGAMDLLRQRRLELGAASGVPACLPQDVACAIYLDLGTASDQLGGRLKQLAEVMADNSGVLQTAWAATEHGERERLRIFRHALPEGINAVIARRRLDCPEITKLGTDMAVPTEHLDDIMRFYRQKLDAAQLHYVIFGHIGDSHLHVNILPRDGQDYLRGWELYHQFAGKTVSLGGSPAAEHGIGKLKCGFLTIMYGEAGVAQMRAVKEVFDPAARLGKGTLFT